MYENSGLINGFKRFFKTCAQKMWFDTFEGLAMAVLPAKFQALTTQSKAPRACTKKFCNTITSGLNGIMAFKSTTGHSGPGPGVG